MFDDQENMVQAGSLWLSETGIVLYFYDTGDVVPLDVTVSGDLVNIENDLMFVPAGGIQTGNGFRDDGGIDPSEYIGLWEYVGENLWLCIYDDDTWSFFNDQEDVIANGTLTADEYGVTLYFDGSGDEMRLDVAVSGDLLDGENNGTLVPADKIESCVPYFTRNGFEINAAVDAGTYLLKNGACSYYNLGKNYTGCPLKTTALFTPRRSAISCLEKYHWMIPRSRKKHGMKTRMMTGATAAWQMTAET